MKKSIFYKAFYGFIHSPFAGFFCIGNFSKSKSATKQTAEQQTSQATGFKSQAAGRGSVVQREIFGRRDIKTSGLKPLNIALIAAGVIASIFVWKKVR